MPTAEVELDHWDKSLGCIVNRRHRQKCFRMSHEAAKVERLSKFSCALGYCSENVHTSWFSPTLTLAQEWTLEESLCLIRHPVVAVRWYGTELRAARHPLASNTVFPCIVGIYHCLVPHRRLFRHLQGLHFCLRLPKNGDLENLM